MAYPTYNKKGKDKWIYNILLRNCFLKHIIEGKIQGGIKVTEMEEGNLSSYWIQ